MRELADKLVENRAGVAQLERIAAIATCREVGCDIRRAGGRNVAGGVRCCSAPDSVCTRCGDRDDGDKAEAVERQAGCDDRVTNYGPTWVRCRTQGGSDEPARNRSPDIFRKRRPDGAPDGPLRFFPVPSLYGLGTPILPRRGSGVRVPHRPPALRRRPPSTVRAGGYR